MIPLIRNVFVFDMDNTLLSTDGSRIVVRPYADAILNSLSKKTHNYLVLWSAGTRNYVFNVLAALNWFFYFKLILTREDCTQSQSLYNEFKSCRYVRKKISTFVNPITLHKIKFILIDDRANEMEEVTRRGGVACKYDVKINISPFYGQGPDLELFNALKPYI